MPFTFSHPAIILPLTYLPKKWVSLTGLVIGSLTPDFEYFIRMKVLSNFSHTLYGLFWFDLPFGILLTFIFHLFVRDALLQNLPLFLRQRTSGFKALDWITYFKSNWFVVITSILIGASSHLFWDAFTHDNGYFVQRLPTLLRNVDIFDFSFSVHKIIQHLSTIVGALAILFALLSLPKTDNAKEKINQNYWLLVIGISLLIVALRVLFGLSIKQYGHLIVSGMSGFMIALIVSPILFRLMRKPTNR